MTYWILVGAFLINGQFEVFAYGDGDKPKRFETQEACEKQLARSDAELQSKAVPPYALKCVAQKVDGA